MDGGGDDDVGAGEQVEVGGAVAGVAEVVEVVGENVFGGVENGRGGAEVFAGDDEAEVKADAVQIEKRFEELVGVLVVFPAVVPKDGRGGAWCVRW